jgi:hypothetical protein
LSLLTEILPLFENATLLKETWGKRNISKSALLEGMKKLKEHANKCIDQGGVYFEE